MSNSRRRETDSGDGNFIDDSSLDVDQAILVCKVREDGELAQRLQKEEEERHYARNIEIRHLAVHDLRKAKELQDEEDQLHREWLQKKEDEDRRRAAYLQQKIYRKELEDRHQKESIAKRDEREARKLAAEDEKIKKLEKLQVINDRKMAEQLVAKMNINQSKDHHHSKDEQYARNLAKSEEAERQRTEQEIIDFQKAALLQDEELARHIHEEEMREAEGEFPPHPRAGSSKHMPSKKSSSSHGNSKKLANISSQHQKIKKIQQQTPPRPPPPNGGGIHQRQYSNNRDKHRQVDNGAAAADDVRPPSRPSTNPNLRQHGDRRQPSRETSSSSHHPSSSSSQSRNASLYGSRLHDNDKDLPIDEDSYQESYARFVSSNSAERPRDYDDRRGGSRRRNKGEKNENCKQQ